MAPPLISSIQFANYWPRNQNIMPLASLHLAAGLPIKEGLGVRFSLTAFILANLLILIEPWVIMHFDVARFGYPADGGTGTLLVAIPLGAFAAALASIKIKNQAACVIGGLWGAVSHVLLDALVHRDVYLFLPFYRDGNPLYIGYFDEVSLICAAGIGWYLAKRLE